MLPSSLSVCAAAELAVGFYDPSNIGVSNEVLASATFWLVILVSSSADGGQGGIDTLKVVLMPSAASLPSLGLHTVRV